MKSPSAYYLLLLYTTLMIQPLIPIIMDEWSHQFNEMEHITRVHMRYGSNHLEKEIFETENDNKNKESGASKSENQLPFHLFYGKKILNLSLEFVTIHYNKFLLQKLPVLFLPVNLPPPKFC